MIELRAYVTRTNLVLGQMLAILCARGVADGQEGFGEAIRIALRKRNTQIEDLVGGSSAGCHEAVGSFRSGLMQLHAPTTQRVAHGKGEERGEEELCRHHLA